MTDLRLIVSAAVIAATTACATPGPRPGPYFYTNRGYGSDATFNPITTVLNEGFDFLQVHGRERRVLRYDYTAGLHMIGRGMAHPMRAFESDGVHYILKHEILPIGNSGAWIPNYQLHLLGAGMVYAKTEEWYAQHGVPGAPFAAVVTMAASHVLNEIIEQPPPSEFNGPQIVDLLIFDPAGVLLFQSRRVRAFMSDKLHFTNWPGMASFAPARRPNEWRVENASQSYTFKIPLRSSRWFLFGNWGAGNLYGLTRRASDGRAISVAVGAQAGELVQPYPWSTRTTLSLNGAAGVFYDRDNSLMASVVASASKYRGVEINIYPGALWMPQPRLGLWVHLPRAGPITGGVSLPWVPGVAWRP
ncbi:MAG TPA: hypothetical protein VIP11_01315 [Gemmatimonadaceae bacterium]